MEKGQPIEAIYATLPNEELYKEITNKHKYRQDDFYNTNKEIKDSYFKARGLAFEYFINTLLVDTFKFEELPRVFFRLKKNGNNNEIKELNNKELSI